MLLPPRWSSAKCLFPFTVEERRFIAADDAEYVLILPGGQIIILDLVIQSLQTFQAMMEQAGSAQPETILDQWLREPDKVRAAALLDGLVSLYAGPLIRRIVGFKLTSLGSRVGGGIQRADVDDVCSNAFYQLLARLERLKSGERQPAVRNFSGYVAVTAYNACNEYFRSKKPAWLSLAMKLRYLMTHSPRLALWDTADGQEVCGFAHFHGRPPASDAATLGDARTEFRQSADPSRLSTSELAEAILHAADAPLIFDALVEIAADWSGLREAQVQSLEEDRDEEAKPWEQLQDAQATAETRLIGRHYMERLWAEICELPIPHRKALLLNLNDGAGGDIQLLVHLGVASVEQIAKALEMRPMEFAMLWNELPLDDARIARELGISRQDVVNRRSAARKRLVRRMKEIG
jgi:DNA-directed RNA polymerase specialized sigma24 family protein